MSLHQYQSQLNTIVCDSQAVPCSPHNELLALLEPRVCWSVKVQSQSSHKTQASLFLFTPLTWPSKPRWS